MGTILFYTFVKFSTDTQSPDPRTQNSDANFSWYIFEETENL